MEPISKILRTPSAFVLFLVAILSLIGIIIKSNFDERIARIPVDATITAEAKLTQLTNTQTPQLISTLTSTPMILDPLLVTKQWPVTFSDNFNNTIKNDWPALSDTEGATVTIDLIFKVGVITNGHVRSAKYRNIKSQLSEDFFLSTEVLAKQQTGCYYGLLFRIDEAKNYYWFQIRHGIKYKLEQRSNGNTIDLIPEKNIRPDIEINSIAILGKGDMYELYANDQLLDKFQSNLIKGSQAGIATTTCQFLESAEYIFDNFQIQSLNPTKSLPLTTNIITDFTVLANKPWQNSGLNLTPGNIVSVKYVDGQWRISPKDNYIGAAGYNMAMNLIIPDAKYSALLARIGEKGKPFEVGTSLDFTAHESGYLFFQINDGNLDDNDGSVKVKINITQ